MTNDRIILVNFPKEDHKSLPVFKSANSQICSRALYHWPNLCDWNRSSSCTDLSTNGFALYFL